MSTVLESESCRKYLMVASGIVSGIIFAWFLTNKNQNRFIDSEGVQVTNYHFLFSCIAQAFILNKYTKTINILCLIHPQTQNLH
jgi:ABC-type transporter Mla maintaining outer membrane lipid asymmetry permease subunit MlaE